MLLNTVNIKNWREVKDQFGLEQAKKIGKGLTSEINKHSDFLADPSLEVWFKRDLNTVCVPCSINSDAIAIFKLVAFQERNQVQDYVYEYTGTAN